MVKPLDTAWGYAEIKVFLFVEKNDLLLQLVTLNLCQSFSERFFWCLCSNSITFFLEEKQKPSLIDPVGFNYHPLARSIINSSIMLIDSVFLGGVFCERQGNFMMARNMLLMIIRVADCMQSFSIFKTKQNTIIAYCGNDVMVAVVENQNGNMIPSVLTNQPPITVSP